VGYTRNLVKLFKKKIYFNNLLITRVYVKNNIIYKKLFYNIFISCVMLFIKIIFIYAYQLCYIISKKLFLLIFLLNYL